MDEEIKEDMARCHCPNCPSYNDCTRQGEEVLYCLTRKSVCLIKSNGCICGGCPVYKENHFKSGYSCIQGKE